MNQYYLIIGLTYFVIGLAVAFVFYYLLQRPFLGRFWGSLVVGLIGSFVGGMLDFLLLGFDLLLLADTVDVVPPLITSVILVWLYSNVSRRESS